MKAFLFDIDGTLTPMSSGKILDSTYLALNLLKEKGYKVGVVTGRNLGQVMELFDIKLFDFISLCNGAYFYKDGKIIHKRCFTKVELEETLKVLRDNNLGYFCTDYYSSIVDEKGLTSGIVNLCKNKFNVGLPKLVNLDDYDISQFMSDADFKYIEKFSKLDYLDIVKYNYGYGFDICLKACGKGQGVLDIKDEYNLDYKDIYVFGDGYNDLAMFKDEVVKIAMGNACDALKKKANYITDDAQSDGIYNILKKLEVI